MVVMNILRTVVLARLLTPQDFGIVSMVSVIVGFAALFKDAGLSLATVQKETISPGEISTLFWLNIAISIFVGLSIVALAPFISLFYNKPELTYVTIALSLSVVIQGFGIQHAALLRRHMYFLTLGFIEIFSSIVGLSIAIFFALQGFNYWALVLSTISISIASVSLTYIFCPWIPNLPKRRTGARKMLRFGMHVSGYNILTYITQHVDQILIGKFIGPYGLGIYNRAHSVVQMPIFAIRKPIANVSVSAFSRIQNEPDKIKKYADKYVLIISFFSMPVMAFCFVYSESLILLLLGKNWDEVVPLFRILSLAGFIQLPLTITSLLLVTCGKSQEYLRIGILTSTFFLFFISLGIMWGTTGVAFAYVASTYILSLPMLFYMSKHVPYTTKDFFTSIARPVFASVLSGLIFFHLPAPCFELLFLNVLCSGLFFLFVFVLIFTSTPNGFSILKNDIFSIVRHFK
ncbi:polysaccharide transporter, PST family [Desulfonatronum thiosulfatophilum]|uniref:Polysaccharide transporter, PST family n=2 Tax=Desulfonatronum thiosulfatophilum TaxID=617002 RepID=A0A1G6EC28_9BACT|nr:polysaccharide transporter, PST family [Desulfonatronum thiosulfatophilum]